MAGEVELPVIEVPHLGTHSLTVFATQNRDLVEVMQIYVRTCVKAGEVGEEGGYYGTIANIWSGRVAG